MKHMILATRTETISRSDAVKMIAAQPHNYARIQKKYISYTIGERLEVSPFSQQMFLEAQPISEGSRKVYRTAVNRFRHMCDQYHVLKVEEDHHLKKREKLDHSLDSYVLAFLAEVERDSTKETYHKALTEFVRFVEDNRLPVTKQTAVAWKKSLVKRLSPYTVNLYLSALRQFVKYMVDRADVFGERSDQVSKELNRITTVKNASIQKDQLVKDVFSREQIQQILDHSDPQTRQMVALMYYAGLRTVEVIRLTVEDVGADSIQVHGKGKDHKVAVPMNDKLKALLADRPASGDMFPGVTTSQIRKSVNKVLAQLGLKQGEAKRSCHSFRHSFCTHLIESGVPIHQVKTLARHASITTTEQYLKALERKTMQQAGITNVL